MKVSIIVPVYNCSQYLDKSLRTFLAQTYRDLEILLVNDGSSDNSLEICRRFESADERITVIHKEKSEGAGPARNSGMDAAQGDFLMFLDADDWISPNMVEKLVAAIQKTNTDIAICGYDSFVEGITNGNKEQFCFERQVFDTPEKTKTFFASWFPDGRVGYLWNKLYRAEFIRENHIRFPDMRRLQDGVFNVAAFNNAHSCCVIEDILYHYRINAQNDMFRKCPKNYFDLIKQFSEYYLTEKNQWGNFSNEKILTFFMNELGTCIENAFSPQWNMSPNERGTYFAQIAGDEFFQFACKGEYHVEAYRRKLIELMQKKQYRALHVIVGLKVFLKTAYKPVFYLLKRI